MQSKNKKILNQSFSFRSKKRKKKMSKDEVEETFVNEETEEAYYSTDSESEAPDDISNAVIKEIAIEKAKALQESTQK
jgi:hypothetical protein